MKDVDFLPSWYRTKQRLKARFNSHYMMIGMVFLMLMGWSFVAGHVVSKARADVTGLRKAFDKGVHQVSMAQELDAKIADLSKKKKIFDQVKKRTNLTAVLGELAFLTDQAIVIKSIDLREETLGKEMEAGASTAVVMTVTSVNSKSESPLPSGPIKQCVVIKGIAAGAPDVAMLISRLEESAYFKKVNPIYSRNSKIKDKTVTEFEIQADVNDYIIK